MDTIAFITFLLVFQCTNTVDSYMLTHDLCIEPCSRCCISRARQLWGSLPGAQRLGSPSCIRNPSFRIRVPRASSTAHVLMFCTEHEHEQCWAYSCLSWPKRAMRLSRVDGSKVPRFSPARHDPGCANAALTPAFPAAMGLALPPPPLPPPRTFRSPISNFIPLSTTPNNPDISESQVARLYKQNLHHLIRATQTNASPELSCRDIRSCISGRQKEVELLSSKLINSSSSLSCRGR